MPSEFDPFDAATVHDSWPLLKQLREAGPIARIGDGMYYITRSAEARTILRDTETFSSAAGFRAPGVEVPGDDRMLGEQDPPHHGPVRRVMAAALNTTTVRGESEYIARAASELLRDLRGRDGFDLVETFAIPLPTLATVHILGFPLEDAGRIATWTHEVMASTWPALNSTERGEGFDGAFPEFCRYIDDAIAQRRADPADDVVSTLIDLDVDGTQLNQRQVRALVYNLLLGGMTTTSQLIGNLLHEILVTDVGERLRGDPAAIANAVDESMRLHPPVMFIPRGCVRDTVIDGVAVSAGERVIVGTACANRDETEFPDPDSFRVDRDNSRLHLTLGHGPHVCVGAHLARTVAAAAITAFLDTFDADSVRLADDFRFENVPTFFEYGPVALPVTVMGES